MSQLSIANDRVFREMLDAIPQSVCVVDRDGRVIYANFDWRSHLTSDRFDPEHIDSDLNYFDLILSDDVDSSLREFERGLREVLRGERDTFELEHRCPLRAGHPWMLGQVRPVAATDHFVVTHVQARREGQHLVEHAQQTSRNLFRGGENINDLTEGRRARDESERRVRLMVEQTRAGFCSVTLDGRFVEVNDGFCELTGYSRDALMSMTFQEITHPEDLAENLEKLEAILRGETPFFMLEKRYLREDGTIRWVSLTASPLLENGEPVGVIGVVQDITEGRMAKQALEGAADQYRAIVETSADAYWKCEKKGRLLEVNEQACTMSGYSADELCRMSISDIEAAETAEEVTAHIERVRSRGFDRFETRHRRKDGTELDVEVSVSSGRGGEMLVFVHDITPRKRAEQLLQVLYRVAEASASPNVDLEELCGTVQGALGMLVDTSNFYVALKEDDGCLTVPLFVDSKDALPSEAFPSGTLTAWVIARGTPVLLDRGSYDELVESGEIGRFGASFESWLGVPLRHGGKVLGLIAVQSYDPGLRFTESDLEIIDLASQSVAAAIDRKRTLLALAKAEASLRALVDASPDATFLLDPDGTIVMGNDEIARRLGFDQASAVVGLNAFDHLPDEVATSRRAWIEEVLRTGEMDSFEDERQGRRIESLAAPVRDPDGNVTGVAVFGRDVTAAREGERRLRESEEKFRHIVEGLGAILWEAAVSPLAFTFVSSQAEEILGYPVREWLESIDFWASLIHPDERTATLDACAIATAQGTDHELEYRLRKADATYLWVRDIVRVVKDESGQPVRLVGLIVDDSAHKQAEEALRDREETYEAMFRNNHAIKLIIDPETGNILDANPAAAGFYGYSTDELLEMNLVEIHTMPRDQLMETLRRVSGSRGVHIETRHRLADGSVREVGVHAGPMIVRGRTVLFAIVHDQAEIKAAERAASRHEMRLKAQNEALRLIAESAPLPEVLTSITESIERLAPEALGSILLVDSDGVTLRHGAAPSLPEEYTRQIDGLLSGEGVGSCGTAVARKSAVFVTDIQTDPLWSEYRELADQYGFRACWSTPIVSASGAVLGTFAMYFREPREPVAEEFEAIDMAVALARAAIEQAHSQDALRQTRQHLIHVIESSPLPIVELSPGGTVSLWNKAATQCFGWKPAEVLGRQAPLVPPEGRGEFSTLLEVVGQGESITGRGSTFIRKDGARRDVSIHAAPIRDDRGAISGATVVVEDVTETRAREAVGHQLATAIENAPDSVVVTDRNGSIIHCNPSFCRITGYDLEDLVGRTPRILKSGRHNDAEYARMWESITSGRIWRGKLWNRKKAGTLFHEDKTIAPVFDASGAITGYVSIGRDITMQEQLEDALRDRQRIEAVGQLAGGIAHDFNNLLQVILSYLQFTRAVAEEKAPEVLADIDEARRAATRAADLTRQLLAFSRRQVLELRPVNLNDVVAGILKMIGRIIGENVALRFQPRTDIPVVLADPTQIEQVLLNLCLNGRDAMPDGGELEIRTDHASGVDGNGGSADGFVELSVRDTGVGIPPDAQLRVFEPFFTTKGQTGGSGLGLATVYGIVRQHGGVVDFESIEGEGTCFRVALPVHQFDSVSAETTEEGTEVLRGTETILFAEDEEPIRRVIERGLREAGYDVVSSKDGREAIEAFIENPDRISLALLDVVMPQIGGADVQRAIHRVRPDVPVLFCTGYNPEERLRLPDEQVDVIMKPFAMQRLLKRIRDVLDRSPQASMAEDSGEETAQPGAEPMPTE